MLYKVGIFGSAVEEKVEIVEKAKELGRALAKNNIVVITVACSGLPYAAAFEAAGAGIEVWGYTPEVDFESHQKAFPNDDATLYKKLYYVPEDYRKLFSLEPFDQLESDRLTRMKLRNVISTTNCDAGIIISGRWGSMNEFTNLYDMGKVIGVLTGTGGIADELPSLCQKISKPSKAKVLFDDSPENLVEKVMQELTK